MCLIIRFFSANAFVIAGQEASLTSFVLWFHLPDVLSEWLRSGRYIRAGLESLLLQSVSATRVHVQQPRSGSTYWSCSTYQDITVFTQVAKADSGQLTRSATLSASQQGNENAAAAIVIDHLTVLLLP